MTCSPGCTRHPRWLCRARARPAPWPLSGRWPSVAALGNPDASGYSADLPPQQWACAPAGSKGLKKTLINISASLFSLPGTSPDIPVVRCTQFLCSATDFAEIYGSTSNVVRSNILTAPHPASPCARRRGRRIALSRRNFENYTVVASALVAEDQADAPGSNPGARSGRAGSSPAERTLWCRVSVTELGRRIGFRLRCP